MSMYPREVIAEMNKLSKEVFRSESKWRKLIDKGERVLATEEVNQLVIDKEGNESLRPTKIQVLHTGKNEKTEMPLYVLKRYTLAEVKEKMLQIKAQHEAIRESIRKKQEADKAAAETKKLVESVSGSSV